MIANQTKPWIATIVLLATVLANPEVRAQAPDAEPEIVLIQSNPWLMVVGSDSPSFALYDDGTVIYRRQNEFVSMLLTEEEHETLLASVGPITAENANQSFEIATMTDQPSNLLLILDDEPIYVGVYGRLDNHGTMNRLPSDVREAIEAVLWYRHPDARPWLPDFIEVMVWGYDYAPDASIIWPAEWPGLDDVRTVRRGEDIYSIYIPAAERDALSAFLQTRNRRGAIEIDGIKFTASVRYPFAGEDLWMGDQITAP